MKVFEEKLILKMPPSKSEGRSKGLHVSEIIRDLAFTGKILDAKYYTELKFEEQDTNMIQAGFMFEDYMSKYKQIDGVDFHPGELYMDSAAGRIYMSPDGWSLGDPDDWAPEVFIFCVNVLHELKFTCKSSRDFAQGLRIGSKKSLMWVWQIRAYCKTMNTLAAKLHVMFAQGNHSKTFDDNDPEAKPMRTKTFRLLMEQQEVDENWNMLVAHAQEMIKNGKFKPVTGK
jgi:hypothetical protein